MLARYPTLLIAAALLITDAVAQVPGFPKLPQLPIALPGAGRQQAATPPANQPAGKPDAIASIAADARCEHVFEATGPMTALADGAKDFLTGAISGGASNGGASPDAMRERF